MMLQKFFNVLIALTPLWAQTAFAEEHIPKERVRKEINKTFEVNADALLEVSNSYGNLNITTWEENTIVIDVEIIVEGSSTRRIEDKLESIEISFNANPDKVSARTEIENSWSRGLFSFDSMNLEINYTIKMPVNGAVDLENDYGAILLNQLNGNATISCDYGKMIIGELNGEYNVLNFDYTNNSTIEYIRSGKINADYSGFDVGEAETIQLDADYTNASFESLSDLDFNMDYGKLHVANAKNINGNADYTSIRLGAIAEAIKINADYGTIKVNKLLPGFSSVTMDLEYVSTKIGLDDKCSFNFELDLEYCGFSSAFPFDYKQKIQEASEKYFRGSYNNKQDNMGSIRIDAEYGALKFEY